MEAAGSSDQPPFGAIEAMRRDIRDLLQFVPECEGAKWIENMNSIFELLETKVSDLLNAVLAVATDGNSSNKTRRTLKKVKTDCNDIINLLQVQKDKLQILVPNKGSYEKVFPFNPQFEKSLLQKMFGEKAALVKHVPVPVREGRFSRFNPIGRIHNANGNSVNDYSWILQYPAAIFPMSELRVRTAKNLTNARLEHIVFHLKNLGFVSFCPIKHDYLVIKNFCASLTSKFEYFNMTRGQFIATSTPRSLQSFRELTYGLQGRACNKLDENFFTAVSLILIATLLMDPQPTFRHSDFPPMPNVIQATINPLLGTLVSYTEKTHGPDGEPDVIYTKRNKNAIESRLVEKKYLGES